MDNDRQSKTYLLVLVTGETLFFAIKTLYFFNDESWGFLLLKIIDHIFLSYDMNSKIMFLAVLDAIKVQDAVIISANDRLCVSCGIRIPSARPVKPKVTKLRNTPKL